MGYTVSSLPAYVEQNRLPLLKAAILKGKTVEVINRQSGVKGKAALNIVDITAPFQSGADCGFNASGNDTFTQRTIETALLKVEKSWCWKTLIGKWTEYQMRNGIEAGEKELDFEEFFLNTIAEKIAAKIEEIIWQGLTISGTTLTKGLLAELQTASVDPTANAGSTYYEKVLEAYNAIPEAVLDSAVIFVGAGVFRGLVQNLVAANLYHFDPGAPKDELILPGTDTRVIKVNGLNSATMSVTSGGSTTVYENLIVAADPQNLVYGYDIEGSERDFDVWYEKKDDAILFRMQTNIGSQVAIPSEVKVYGTPRA